MPEVTPRYVHPDDLDRALRLLDAAGSLNTRGNSNNPSVQDAVSSAVVDLIVYAKELLKTPGPVEADPPVEPPVESPAE